jgi:hypothetical protein
MGKGVGMGKVQKGTFQLQKGIESCRPTIIVTVTNFDVCALLVIYMRWALNV